MKSHIPSSIFSPISIWPTLIICIGLVSANKGTTRRQMFRDMDFADTTKVNSSTDNFPGQLSSSTASVHNPEPDTKTSLVDFIDRYSKMLANLKYLKKSNWEVKQGSRLFPRDDAESKFTKRHIENIRPSAESDGAGFPPELIAFLSSQMINSTWIHPYLLALYNTSMATEEEPSPSAEHKWPPTNTDLDTTPFDKPHWRFGRALNDTGMELSQYNSSLNDFDKELSQNISLLMDRLGNTTMNGTAMDLNSTGPPAPTTPPPYNLTKDYNMMVPEIFAYLYDTFIHKSVTTMAMMMFGNETGTEIKNHLDHIATFISGMREGRNHLELYGASSTYKEEVCGQRDCPYLTEPDTTMCIKTTNHFMNCSWVEIMPLDKSYPRQWWLMEMMVGMLMPEPGLNEFFSKFCMCPPQVSLDSNEILVQLMAQYTNMCETQIIMHKWHALKTWPPIMG